MLRTEKVAIAATLLMSLHARELPDQTRLPQFDDIPFDLCVHECANDLDGPRLIGMLHLVEAVLCEGSGEPPRDLISQERAAVIARVCSNTIRRWIGEKSLPAHGLRRQISEAELRTLLPMLPQRRPRAKSKRSES